MVDADTLRVQFGERSRKRESNNESSFKLIDIEASFLIQVGAKELVLSTGLKPYVFKRGQVYRLWYGEDLFNSTESDNSGRVCALVYALV